MNDFEERLKNAIGRGQRKNEAKNRAEEARRMNLEELKRLHGQYRLKLTDYIENCVNQLPDHFPGFQFETVLTERGWGAAVIRDDIIVDRSRRRNNFFSRFEFVVRPFSEYGVLNIAAKGTIQNKELLTRDFYEKLGEVDLETFYEMIDRWTLEYAELYASKS